MPVEILHGSDPGVARVPIVEIVQLLSLLPVPETVCVSGGKGQRVWVYGAARCGSL